MSKKFSCDCENLWEQLLNNQDAGSFCKVGWVGEKTGLKNYGPWTTQSVEGFGDKAHGEGKCFGLQRDWTIREGG